MKKLISLLALLAAGQNSLYSQCQPPCGGSNSNVLAITSSSATQDSVIIRYVDPATGKEELRTAYWEEGDDIAYPPQQISINYISTAAVSAAPYSIVHTIQYANGKSSSFRLWENGEVAYEFPIDFPADMKSYIETVMEYLQTNTNICFRERTPSDAGAIRFITNHHLQNKTNPPNGWSYIGRIGQKTQELFINQNVLSCIKGGVILHELCHAIGLPHQHQLPNRNQYIKLNPDNLTDIGKDNFNLITNLPGIYNYPSYSIQSIMHYSPCSGSKNSKYVFDCLNYTTCPNDVGQRTRLDIIDVLNINKLYPKKGCSTPTLLLMDVSGSMMENDKFNQAKAAAAKTVNTIEQESKQSGKTPEIGIMVFSGECVTDPTTMVLPFTTILDQVRSGINLIPPPNGRTPLPDAVEQARKTLEDRLAEKGQTCGDLILLGDGQSTCGNIRPPMAYSGNFKENKCVSNTASGASIRMFTVGFGIEPGSEAERDLQYLAFSSGGKYFNAQNEYQLTRAFQKINRIYLPILIPQSKNLPQEFDDMFSSGVGYVYSQEYDTALISFRNFFKAYPTDSAGIFNLALMCEATERYKAAARYYKLYLQFSPNDKNRAAIEEKIRILLKDYEIFAAYVKEYLKSDLAYLQRHFELLQYTPDAVPLAGEFTGFIAEKYRYYLLLPELLEKDEPWLKQYSKEISQSLREADFYLRKKPEAWGDEGVYRIGLVHEPMRRLVKQLGG